MRRFFYLASLLAAGALLSSCNWGIQIYQPTSPSIFVVNQNTDRLEVGPEAQEQIVYISSDLFWYATMKDGRWCNLGDYSYYNEFTSSLSFKVSANNSMESRLDSLIVLSGDQRKAIAIVQNGLGSLIATDAIELHGTIPVQYKFDCKGAWTVEQRGDWFTVTPVSYSTGNVVTFTANDDNRNTDTRTGSVTFKLAGLSLTIPVSQIITETVIVESKGVSLESAGGEFKIHTRTNVEYTVSSDVDWLQVLGTRALLEFDEYFNAEANMSSFSRTGHLKFTYGDISETVTVTQEARDPILDKTTPGYYGIIGESSFPYVKGKWQTSRLTTSSGRAFRQINTETTTVLQLKNVPLTLNVGEIIRPTFTYHLQGVQGYSKVIELKVLGENEKLIWLKNSDQCYIILKKQ